MPTRRMIHVELWQSETIARLTRDQRLLFIGLFSNADDQGRLRGHPMVVRSIVYPYDDISLEQMEADLAALVGGDFIIRYGSGTKSLIQIKNWWTYQQPQWAYPSAHPPPEGWADCIRGRKGGQVYTENWPPAEWNRRPPSDDDDDPGDALPKGLPNGLGNGDGQSDSIGKYSSSSSSRNSKEIPTGSANADDAGPAPESPEPEQLKEKAPEKQAPPQNLAGWLGVLRTVSNKQALIRRFIELHYPGHDIPDYGRIAKSAKRLGRGIDGYTRLLSLLYQVECYDPKGDVLAYVLAVAKNEKADAAYYREGYDRQSAPDTGHDTRPELPVPKPPSPFQAEWDQVLIELRAALGNQPVARWLRGSALLERQNGHAKIELADDACLDWVSNRWAPQLAQVLRRPGHDEPEIEFVVSEKMVGPRWLEQTRTEQQAAA